MKDYCDCDRRCRTCGKPKQSIYDAYVATQELKKALESTLSKHYKVGMAREKKQCEHVFKKGKQANQRCTRTFSGDANTHCYEHRKHGSKEEETSVDENMEMNEPEILLLPKPGFIFGKHVNKSVSHETSLGLQSHEAEKEDVSSHEIKNHGEPSHDHDLPPLIDDDSCDDEYIDELDIDFHEMEEPCDEGPSEEEIQKEKMISVYYTQFPWLKKELPLRSRGNRSSDEWLSEINTLLDNKGIDKLVFVGFNGVCNVIENIGCRKGMKIQGYSQAMTSRDEVNELLKIIRLRSMNNVSNYITPEWQLAGIMMTTALSLHTMNTNKIPNES